MRLHVIVPLAIISLALFSGHANSGAGGAQDDGDTKIEHSWLTLSHHYFDVACEYEVEIKWLDIQLMNDAETTNAVQELLSAHRSEGLQAAATDTIRIAFDELFTANIEGVKSQGPGRYRIARKEGSVLQTCLTTPAVHELRTPDLIASYSYPPGRLVVGGPKATASLFEPSTLLSPLPSGLFFDEWSRCDWEEVRPRVFQAKHGDSGSQSTVLLDAKGRPLAFWDRQGTDPHSIISGYYEWRTNEAGQHEPSRMLRLSGGKGYISGRMYEISSYTENVNDIVPVLVLDELVEIVDVRGREPRLAPNLKSIGLQDLILLINDFPQGNGEDGKN